MHPASAFRQTDPVALARLVAERGLALIVAGEGKPVVAHAPVLLDGRRLRFHLASANPVCAAIARSGAALAVVTGADAYVSPDWYAAADQVPTWNYLSVEIEGATKSLDAAGTRLLLDDLSARFEAALAPKPPWTVAKVDPAKLAPMLAAITGFEMRIERLEGVTKLSQNKPPTERARVAAALAQSDDPAAREIARLMGEPFSQGEKEGPAP
jgi:transcriptional regulator